MGAPLRLLLVATAALVCSTARADKVHLAGGSVIEGKVTRSQGKVVIALESGTVVLSSRDVVRIELAETPLERLDREREKLEPRAIAERLALASAYHAASLYGRERELLEEVLALDPQHAEARRRLLRGKPAPAQPPADALRAARESSQRAREALVNESQQREQQRAKRAEDEARRLRAQLDEERAQRGVLFLPAPRLWGDACVSSHGCSPLLPPALPRPSAPSSAPPFLNGVRAPESYFP